MSTCSDFTGNHSKINQTSPTHSYFISYQIMHSSFLPQSTEDMRRYTKCVSQYYSMKTLLCFYPVILSNDKNIVFIRKYKQKDGTPLLYMYWCLNISKSYFQCSKYIKTNSQKPKNIIIKFSVPLKNSGELIITVSNS